MQEFPSLAMTFIKRRKAGKQPDKSVPSGRKRRSTRLDAQNKVANVRRSGGIDSPIDVDEDVIVSHINGRSSKRRRVSDAGNEDVPQHHDTMEEQFSTPEPQLPPRQARSPHVLRPSSPSRSETIGRLEATQVVLQPETQPPSPRQRLDELEPTTQENTDNDIEADNVIGPVSPEEDATELQSDQCARSTNFDWPGVFHAMVSSSLPYIEQRTRETKITEEDVRVYRTAAQVLKDLDRGIRTIAAQISRKPSW